MKQMKSCWPNHLLPLLSWVPEFECCWLQLARVKTEVSEVLQRDGAIAPLCVDLDAKLVSNRYLYLTRE